MRKGCNVAKDATSTKRGSNAVKWYSRWLGVRRRKSGTTATLNAAVDNRLHAPTASGSGSRYARTCRAAQGKGHESPPTQTSASRVPTHLPPRAQQLTSQTNKTTPSARVEPEGTPCTLQTARVPRRGRGRGARSGVCPQGRGRFGKRGAAEPPTSHRWPPANVRRQADQSRGAVGEGGGRRAAPLQTSTQRRRPTGRCQSPAAGSHAFKRRREAVVPPRRWAPQARASRETVGGGGTRDQQRGGGGGGWARARRTVSKIQKGYQRQCGTAGCVRGKGNPQTTTRRARYAAAVLNRSGRGTTTTTVDVR